MVAPPLLTNAARMASTNVRLSARGAGLGLALSPRIARVSAGDVSLDPAPGPTRFVLRLPG